MTTGSGYQTTEWPQSGGGPQRHSRSESRLAPPLKLSWKLKTGKSILDSPLVRGDRVFIGSLDATYRCLNVRDGHEVWCHAFESSPDDPRLELGALNDPKPGASCLTETVVVIPTEYGFLNGLSIETGEQLWCKYISGTMEMAAVFVSVRVFCASRETVPQNLFQLLSVDPNTGELHWTRTLDQRCVALASDGKVGFGAEDLNTGAVFAFDLGSGETLWRHEFPHQLHPGVLVHGDTLIVGSPFPGEVHGLSTTDGRQLWSIPQQRVNAAPVVYDNTLYVVDDATMYAYDLGSGGKLWETQDVMDYRVSSPLVTDQYIFIGGGWKPAIECRLRATGERLWSHKTKGMVYSNPVIAQERLLIGSHDKHLYCFESSKK